MQPTRADTQADEDLTRLRTLLMGRELAVLAALENRTSELEHRVGDDAALVRSAEAVIVDVLRNAGVRDHERLSSALAPLVVQSMREEIRNSADTMVDALYPIVGRLVAAAVRNAFVELVAKINAALDDNLSVDRWMRKVKAKVSGRSEAELLLAEMAPFALEEIYLIHRPSGLLIARSPSDAEAPMDPEVVSGLLSAVMAFVRDAFTRDQEVTLRSIAFGESTLHVRASPAIIMAARSSGVVPPTFEGTFERAFEIFIDEWGDSLRHFDGTIDQAQAGEIQADLAQFETALPGEQRHQPPAGNDAAGGRAVVPSVERKWLSPAATIGIGLGAIVIVWLAYVTADWTYFAFKVAHVENLISSYPALQGYPLEVSREGDRVVVEGLMPDTETRNMLIDLARRDIAPINLETRLSVVADAGNQ